MESTSAGSTPASALSDPNHPARRLIDEASLFADQSIRVSGWGDQAVVQANSVDGQHLVSLVEKALEIAPDDQDLLMAKSGALCLAMQFKTAEEVIDHVLSINPDHFDARQRKEHWEKWENLFLYPSWSTATSVLNPIMATDIHERKRSIQLVRDGLQIGIAIVCPAKSHEFAHSLENVPSKWIPMWSDTPYGAILAHYVVIQDDPSNPWKYEGFLPLNVPETTTPRTGFWLLQRMRRLSSCFIVLSDGERVLYNRRYVFPDTLRATLLTILDKMVRQSSGKDTASFTQACQWHMNNFDIKQVR